MASGGDRFRAVWVNPRFLHYRVPVYQALDGLLGGGLTVVYSAARVPGDVGEMMREALGDRAVALEGERSLSLRSGGEGFSNRGLRLPWQRGLAGAVLAARPEVIVTEGFFQWAPAGFWLRATRGIPLVVAYERWARTERGAGVARTTYRRLLARLAGALCVNGSLSRDYCRDVLGVPAGRIVTGAMAADNEGIARLAAAAGPGERKSLEEGLGLRRPVFLAVGRLVRPKGLRELLEGWERYSRGRGESAGSLVILGDGPERPLLEAMVRERKMTGVAMAGAVEHRRVALFYAVADVLVSPTLEDNWSLVVAEAMACGKPVLCSVYNGCRPELVREGVNGWSFDPLDAAALAALLEGVRSRPERLGEMGERSREIVGEYTPERAAAAVREACLVALGRAGR